MNGKIGGEWSYCLTFTWEKSQQTVNQDSQQPDQDVKCMSPKYNYKEFLLH